MSWDVVFTRTKTNSERLDEIEEENIIPFSRQALVDEAEKAAALTNAECLYSDLSFVNMEGSGWSIEFYIGDAEPVQSVMLAVRGEKEPTEVFRHFAQAFNARIVDCGTGDFMDFSKPSGFEDWKAYRNQMINGE